MKNLFNSAFGKISKKANAVKSKSLADIISRCELSQHLDKLIYSELENMTIIYIKVDGFDNIIKQHGKKVASDILKNLAIEVNNTRDDEHIIAKWSEKEFILACPENSLEKSTVIAKKIRGAIQRKEWKKNVNVTCSTSIAELADEPLFLLIPRLQKPLHLRGINKHFTAKAKVKKPTPTIQADSKPEISKSEPVIAASVEKDTAVITETKTTTETETNSTTPATPKKQKIKSTICTVTGALNHDGLSDYLNQLKPSTLQEMGVIFIAINNLDELAKKHGQAVANEISQRVAHDIILKSRAEDTLGSWSTKEYLLACPNTHMTNATEIAKEIEFSLLNRTWLPALDIELSTKAYDAKAANLLNDDASTGNNLVDDSQTVNSEIDSSDEYSVQGSTKNTETQFDLDTMTCASTGALSQVGVKLFLEQTNEATLQEMSVILIKIAQNSSSESISEMVSKQFVEKINHTCANGIIARFNINEYLLLCPKTTLTQATTLADQIRPIITQNNWSEAVTLTCSTEVYDSDWNEIKAQQTKASSEQVFIEDNVSRISAA